jgi:hypothetical protein
MIAPSVDRFMAGAQRRESEVPDTRPLRVGGADVISCVLHAMQLRSETSIDERHWNQILASALLIPTFAIECAAT